MVIDAKKIFSLQSASSWYRRLAGSLKHVSGDVVPLRPQPEGVFGPDLVSEPDALTTREITLLRNSASLLVTHHHEISVHFYKKVLKCMWWNHSRFNDVIDCEKNRLLSALLALVVRPTETSLVAFFLADNWVKYHFIGDIGTTYDRIACFLNDAIEDVLGENFTPETSVAWRKVLAPNHVFNHGLNTCASKAISEIKNRQKT